MDPRIVGVGPADYLPDDDEVYERALTQWSRTERLQARQQSQEIGFDDGPVCLVFVADLHLGNRGTNYVRIFDDAALIREIPDAWVILLGDLVDNFIVQKLLSVRMDVTFSIDDEWALARRYLSLVGPRLVASVGGNHEGWTIAMSGIDYFREVLTGINDHCLYSPDDCLATIRVGDHRWIMRARHRWLGHSIYNPTHGIERAAKFDCPFDLGIGAHTHIGGLTRQFVSAGRTALAVLCGTYKVADRFAQRQGFPRTSESAAVAVIIDPETGTMTGYNSLARAKRVMEGA